jgi:hypothetical protein
MIISSRVTVGTAVTELVAPRNEHQQVQLLNAGQEVVRIGGANVTANAYGLPRLPDSPNVPRTPFSFKLNPSEGIYAIVAANTSEVNVWVQVP